MLIRVQGVIIRSMDYGEGGKIVTLLTETHGKTGVLKEGLLADICVLPFDLEMTDPATFKGTTPRATVCDGRVVFEG